MARKLTYRPGDRLFEPFNDLTIILAALARALHQVAGTDHALEEIEVMRMTGVAFDWGVAIPLRGPLEIAFKGGRPGLIDIGLIEPEEAQKPLVGAKAETGGFGSVMTHLVQPIFLAFFERYNTWLTASLGDAINWHPTLNFARVIRNAVAHGKINIRDPRAAPASWKNVTLTYADSGKPIIGIGLPMGPTDVIGLMIETDQELTNMGAPVL